MAISALCRIAQYGRGSASDATSTCCLSAPNIGGGVAGDADDAGELLFEYDVEGVSGVSGADA